jgi:predicted RNA-binding protein with RPS1 domain
MAGGEGAKERRRLKRLKGPENAANSTGVEENSTNVRIRSENQAHQSVGGKERNGSSQHPRGGNNDNRFGTKRPPAKKYGENRDSRFGTKRSPAKKDGDQKKSKKPKHLKRKMEQLAEQDDPESRKKLLSEVAEWEKKKEAFTKQNSKRHKAGSVNQNQYDMPVVTPDLKTEQPASLPVMESTTLVDAAEMKIDRAQKPTSKTESEPDRKRKDNAKLQQQKPTSKTESEPDSKPKDNAKLQQQKPTSKTESEPDRKPKDNAKLQQPETRNSSGESDDDSDDEEPQDQRRQRGRRRRGRQDTSKVIEESKPSDNDEDGDNGEMNRAVNDKPLGDDEGEVPNDGKKRYCLGRKPVSDFVLWQKYPARVVYVKPFGVFFDIGCHSDAFCHVSRLQDDFVESPEQLLKEGDEVEARVVEIDRRRKRLTVSLQSEARLEDEQASILAREERKQAMKSKTGKKPKSANAAHPEESSIPKQPASVPSVRANAKQTAPVRENTKQMAPVSEYKPWLDAKAKPVIKTNFEPPNEANMTPAELKRARKLARRAERRDQAEAQ